MPATTTIFQRAMEEYRRTGAIAGFSGGDGSDESSDQNDESENDRQQSQDQDSLGEKGQAALKAERDARKAAEKRLRDLEREKAEREAKERDAAEAKAKADGKLQEVLDARDAELSTLKQAHDQTTTELDALRAQFDAQYATAVKDVPDDLKLFQPADDAGFAAKADFLAKLQESLKKRGTGTTPGNGPNPRPAAGGAKTNEQDAINRVRAKARL